MRPIKFRVWNGEDMISPDRIDRDGTAWWKENSIPTCSKELMQFTGLLDKNGVEIWEGDVLSHGYQVSWCDGLGECLLMAVGWYIQRNNWASWTALVHEDHEVIGNIHANPELVK
jgi:hypothetical protein